MVLAYYYTFIKGTETWSSTENFRYSLNVHNTNIGQMLLLFITDVDECGGLTNNPVACSSGHECINTIGSYYCVGDIISGSKCEKCRIM